MVLTSASLSFILHGHTSSLSRPPLRPSQSSLPIACARSLPYPPLRQPCSRHDRASQPHHPTPLCPLRGLPAIPGRRAQLKALRSLALRGLDAAQTSHGTWKMCFVCLDRLTAPKFDCEIFGLNQFCSLLPKAANLLC